MIIQVIVTETRQRAVSMTVDAARDLMTMADDMVDDSWPPAGLIQRIVETRPEWVREQLGQPYASYEEGTDWCAELKDDRGQLIRRVST